MGGVDLDQDTLLTKTVSSCFSNILSASNVISVLLKCGLRGAPRPHKCNSHLQTSQPGPGTRPGREKPSLPSTCNFETYHLNDGAHARTFVLTKIV